MENQELPDHPPWWFIPAVALCVLLFLPFLISQLPDFWPDRMHFPPQSETEWNFIGFSFISLLLLSGVVIFLLDYKEIMLRWHEHKANVAILKQRKKLAESSIPFDVSNEAGLRKQAHDLDQNAENEDLRRKYENAQKAIELAKVKAQAQKEIGEITGVSGQPIQSPEWNPNRRPSKGRGSRGRGKKNRS